MVMGNSECPNCGSTHVIAETEYKKVCRECGEHFIEE